MLFLFKYQQKNTLEKLHTYPSILDCDVVESTGPVRPAVAVRRCRDDPTDREICPDCGNPSRRGKVSLRGPGPDLPQSRTGEHRQSLGGCVKGGDATERVDEKRRGRGRSGARAWGHKNWTVVWWHRRAQASAVRIGARKSRQAVVVRRRRADLWRGAISSDRRSDNSSDACRCFVGGRWNEDGVGVTLDPPVDVDVDCAGSDGELNWLLLLWWECKAGGAQKNEWESVHELIASGGDARGPTLA